MATEATKEEIEELSARIQSCPRDFLKRFGGNSCHDEPIVVATREAMEEIELSLGLSLGGCFRVEPTERRLVRSSSVATLSMFPLENDLPAVPPLARTSSLPTEEEHRKRKDLQSLKRLEAKRKRSEKKNLLKLASARDQRNENFNEGMYGGHLRVLPTAVQAELGGCHGVPASNQVRRLMHGAASHGLPKWAATSGAGARPIDAAASFELASREGSIGLQGSTSTSGVSDFMSHSVQGSNGCAAVRSPSTTLSLPENTNNEAAISPATMMVDKPAISAREEEEFSKKTSARRSEVAREMERNIVEEMPCVSTTGDGPNGRRVEGFLYRYRKGEEVRIVCVCHGSFLTPAEFVRHAGGGDVAHPLRHIVVSQNPSAFW